MAQDKIHRRRFLADLLFAGGVLSAAALLASQGKSTPTASPTPVPPATPAATPSPLLPTPEPHVQGEMEPPVEPPKPVRRPVKDPFETKNCPEPLNPGVVRIEPNPAGGVRAPLPAPEAALPGRMKSPRPRPKQAPGH